MIVTEMCMWSLTPMAQARKVKSVTRSLGTSSAHAMPELKQKRSTTFMKTVHSMMTTAIWAIVSMILWHQWFTRMMYALKGTLPFG